MGLRLYTPPPESDVRDKPDSEKSPAQLRSSIRRHRISRQSSSDPRSENRRLLLTAAAGRHNANQHARRRNDAERDRQHGRTHETLPHLSPVFTFDDFLQEPDGAPDTGDLAEHFELIHPGVAIPRHDPTVTRSPFNRRPARALHGGPELQYATSSLRSTQDAQLQLPAARPAYPAVPSRRTPLVSDRPGHRPHVPEVTFADDLSRRLPALDASAPRYDEAPRYTGPPLPQPPAAAPARPLLSRTWTRHETDGLGDRNRSLSPADGENLWDTLLTTVTPDPQPPSVGSSFASTTATASAAATQSTAAGSSRTSLTGPETAEESTFEPAYESCFNSESERAEDEEDEDEDAEQQEDEDLYLDDEELAEIMPGMRGALRTYADVVSDSRGGGGDGSNNGDDPSELMSMQRIVRHLARREDIPDEWWAAAGLSRTLSRGGGN